MFVYPILTLLEVTPLSQIINPSEVHGSKSLYLGLVSGEEERMEESWRFLGLMLINPVPPQYIADHTEPHPATTLTLLHPYQAFR